MIIKKIKVINKKIKKVKEGDILEINNQYYVIVRVKKPEWTVTLRG